MLRTRLLIPALLAALLLPSLTFADPPDYFQQATIVEPNFGAYTIHKDAEVFLDTNPSDPFPGDGLNTYFYTLHNDPSSSPLIGINLFLLELFHPDCTPALISFQAGGGVDPVTAGTDVSGRAEWAFDPPLAPGQVSSSLIVLSDCMPSAMPDKVVSTGGEFGLDANGLCFGPMIPPVCELAIDKTCCIPPLPSPGIDQCDGKVLSMKFEYVDEDCSGTTNMQEGKAKCSGDAPGDPIDVVVIKDENKIAIDGVIGGTGTFADGGMFTVTNEVDSNGELKASTKLRLDGPDDSQELTIHTSCSKALSCGDQFGSLQLVELETTEGGIINCEMLDEPGTMCEPAGFPEGTACTEKLSEIVFEYTGLDCAVPLENDQEGKAECSGDPAGASPVNVTYTGDDPDKITVSPAAGVLLGSEVRLTATGRDDLKSESSLLISNGGGTLQSVEIHTSCSKQLALGDVFGALTVVGFTQLGSLDDADSDNSPVVVSLQDPNEEIFLNACEIPGAPPAPHCTSKILDLGLRYIGGDCTITNDQEGKATCTGDPSAGDPVSITITKDADKVSASPDTGISVDDVIAISGSTELGSETKFDVSGPDGTQSLVLHTSCSKPLNLGDRFGPFEVVSLNRKDDGFVSLAGTVEYQYTVTNPNPDTANNVFIDDDVFGPIAGPISVDPNGSETFFITKMLEDDETNTATVTGEVLGTMCEEAEDTVVVTIDDPPPGPFDCSDAKPIDGLTMTWQGPVDVLVVAHDGDEDDPILLTQDNVTLGTEVMVSGMDGGPNDQVWEIFAAGADPLVDTPIGTSKFHISCSDDNMNGTEDCSKPQGNGKSDDGDLINDWELEGIVGSGASLDCTP